MKENKDTPSLVQAFYAIAGQLEDRFPNRHFTPAGHFVSSIGDILAAHYYGLQLLTYDIEAHYAKTEDDVLVQVKTTQGEHVALSEEPEHLIVLQLFPTGRSREIYNGPGKQVWDSAEENQKSGQRQITIKSLKEMMKAVPSNRKVKRATEKDERSDGQKRNKKIRDSISVFISQENTAKFECPECQNVKIVDVSEYMGSEIAIKVKARCKCGHSYNAVVERRKSKRKETDLPGVYMTADGEKGYMTVKDVSRIGLNIKLNSKADLQYDDWLAIEFNLDDRPRSLIKKDVFVRSVYGVDVGVEFSSVDESKEIGFYLY